MLVIMLMLMLVIVIEEEKFRAAKNKEGEPRGSPSLSVEQASP